MQILSAEIRSVATGASHRRDAVDCEKRVEALIANLAHDIRQPLGRLECCAFLLRHLVPAEQERIHLELDRLEQEIQLAEEAVIRAVAELKELRHQRAGTEELAAAEALSLTNAASAGVTY